MARILENDKGVLIDMENKKLKVAMICHFSNTKVQSKLNLKMNPLEKLARIIRHGTTNPYEIVGEYTFHVTNNINEFKKYTEEIELHVISAHAFLPSNIENFEIDGINYHFFQDEGRRFSRVIARKLFKCSDNRKFEENRGNIKKIISQIKPDIVYMIGIEGPFYGLSTLDLPKTMPLMVQLQTLMCDPDFEKNYPISHEDYVYRSSVEVEILKRADYIGTNIAKFLKVIKNSVKPNAVTIGTMLAIGEKPLPIFNIDKKYDFVYWAANINKAFDLALEGFAIAHEKKSDSTMLVMGFYDNEFKAAIDARIKELGLENYITITGRLPTREDIIKGVQSSRIGLLPLKIDIMSSTIREAMACNIPVITTITKDGTELINQKRETVLLSEIGNHQALAENMIRLMDDNVLYDKLIENGKLLLREQFDNEPIVQKQKEALFAVYDNFKNGTPIPEELLS